ncbi:MAG: hypothetical protein EXR77_19900 [Myxococcales bacterium]|nr:hypothetical protein [Myxococcales bacterium]
MSQRAHMFSVRCPRQWLAPRAESAPVGLAPLAVLPGRLATRRGRAQVGHPVASPFQGGSSNAWNVNFNNGNSNNNGITNNNRVRCVR